MKLGPAQVIFALFAVCFSAFGDDAEIRRRAEADVAAARDAAAQVRLLREIYDPFADEPRAPSPDDIVRHAAILKVLMKSEDRYVRMKAEDAYEMAPHDVRDAADPRRWRNGVDDTVVTDIVAAEAKKGVGEQMRAVERMVKGIATSPQYHTRAEREYAQAQMVEHLSNSRHEGMRRGTMAAVRSGGLPKPKDWEEFLLSVIVGSKDIENPDIALTALAEHRPEHWGSGTTFLRMLMRENSELRAELERKNGPARNWYEELDSGNAVNEHRVRQLEGRRLELESLLLGAGKNPAAFRREALDFLRGSANRARQQLGQMLTVANRQPTPLEIYRAEPWRVPGAETIAILREFATVDDPNLRANVDYMLREATQIAFADPAIVKNVEDFRLSVFRARRPQLEAMRARGPLLREVANAALDERMPMSDRQRILHFLDAHNLWDARSIHATHDLFAGLATLPIPAFGRDAVARELAALYEPNARRRHSDIHAARAAAIARLPADHPLRQAALVDAFLHGDNFARTEAAAKLQGAKNLTGDERHEIARAFLGGAAAGPEALAKALLEKHGGVDEAISAHFVREPARENDVPRFERFLRHLAKKGPEDSDYRRELLRAVRSPIVATVLNGWRLAATHPLDDELTTELVRAAMSPVREIAHDAQLVIASKKIDPKPFIGNVLAAAEAISQPVAHQALSFALKHAPENAAVQRYVGRALLIDDPIARTAAVDGARRMKELSPELREALAIHSVFYPNEARLPSGVSAKDHVAAIHRRLASGAASPANTVLATRFLLANDPKSAETHALLTRGLASDSSEVVAASLVGARESENLSEPLKQSLVVAGVLSPWDREAISARRMFGDRGIKLGDYLADVYRRLREETISEPRLIKAMEFLAGADANSRPLADLLVRELRNPSQPVVVAALRATMAQKNWSPELQRQVILMRATDPIHRVELERALSSRGIGPREGLDAVYAAISEGNRSAESRRAVIEFISRHDAGTPRMQKYVGTALQSSDVTTALLALEKLKRIQTPTPELKDALVVASASATWDHTSREIARLMKTFGIDPKTHLPAVHKAIGRSFLENGHRVALFRYLVKNDPTSEHLGDYVGAGMATNDAATALAMLEIAGGVAKFGDEAQRGILRVAFDADHDTASQRATALAKEKNFSPEIIREELARRLRLGLSMGGLRNAFTLLGDIAPGSPELAALVAQELNGTDGARLGYALEALKKLPKRTAEIDARLASVILRNRDASIRDRAVAAMKPGDGVIPAMWEALLTSPLNEGIIERGVKFLAGADAEAYRWRELTARALGDSEPSVRKAFLVAARSRGQLDARTITEVTKALRDADPKVRVEAAHLLGAKVQGDPAVAVALAVAASDPHYDVSRAAEWAGRKVTPPTSSGFIDWCRRGLTKMGDSGYAIRNGLDSPK